MLEGKLVGRVSRSSGLGLLGARLKSVTPSLEVNLHFEVEWQLMVALTSVDGDILAEMWKRVALSSKMRC